VDIIFQYSPWFILLCLALGGLYAFVLYRKDSRLSEFSKTTIIFLASLRFIASSLLAILLLSPLVKYLSRDVEEPIFIVAFDQSASMVQTKDSASIKNELPAQLTDLKERLSGDFQIEEYYFGESLRKAEGAPAFDDRYSNFEQLFEEINIRFENRNVGALLLLSDGIYNRGLNPLYTQDDANYPIYSLAVGDTTQRKDLRITQTLSNKIAFLGNQFPIRVEYQADMAKGQSSELRLYHKGKLVDSKKINFDSDLQNGSHEFLVEAKTSGLQTYQIEIRSIEDEISEENNLRNVYIDVLDGRQNILLLYSSPHPDIAAIQASISSSENYELKSMKWEGSAELEKYDLIILHDLIKANTDISNLLAQAKAKKKPLWHFISSKTAWNKLNSYELPIQATKPLAGMNEVFPLYEEAFPLFQLDEVQQKAISTYPPLKVPQVDLQTKGQNYNLLLQQIGSVPTQLPLLLFSADQENKSAVMLGEGIWKWRIDNYARFGDHQNFDRLITKAVQYLSVKSDKSYFRISHEKEAFENEKLRFDLQLFNKSYDPINEPEAYLDIINEEENTYKYQFNRGSSAYFLELEGLSAGNYSYKAYTRLGEQRLEEVGRFSIKEIKIEGSRLRADHNLLYQLSEKSGGELLYTLDPENFAQKLNQRDDVASISYTTEEVEDLINLKWIFFVLLALIGLEWFIRKYQGAY